MKKNTFLHKKVLPPLGAFLIRALCWTLRFELEDPGNVIDSSRNDSFLFAFWHNRILITPFLYRRYLSPQPLVVMISTSRDGELITKIAERFGVRAARGSSSKSSKGIQAFLRLVRELKENKGHVALTPDGPRGPRYEIHPGIIHLSQASGVPIIPLSCQFSKKWELNSWDKFQIPKPFSTCKLCCHHPIAIPKEVSERELQALTQRLREELG
ncbi:MAG: lysophospholipid acyltransferase family protein [Verrucomicrobiota bacterium]